MPTLTQRLGLIRHTIGDTFKIQDYTDNWQTLDGAPGIHVCTSTTRPSTWATAQAGRHIFETDTGRRFVWDGDSFEPLPAGLLGRAERLTEISTTSTTYTVGLSTGAIPVGSRRRLVVLEGPGVYSTMGLTGLALYRDGTLLQEWSQQGWTGADAQRQPRPLAMTTTDQSPAGTATYTVQFKAVIGYGGTCYLLANTNKPLAITVVEV